MSKKELEKMVGMSQEEYMQMNPGYEPMFPKGWADDKHWPEFESNKAAYDRFRKTQILIDDYYESMHTS